MAETPKTSPTATRLQGQRPMARQTMFNLIVLKAEQLEIRRLLARAKAHFEKSILNKLPK